MVGDDPGVCFSWAVEVGTTTTAQAMPTGSQERIRRTGFIGVASSMEASRGLDPPGLFYGRCGYNGGRRSAMPPAVLTIGHSNHPLERFLSLLARHGVEALVDI